MKVCPKCNQTYDDQNLNFCLNDGEMLTETETVDAPPTIMMDAPRQTNENWGNFDTEFNEPNQPNPQNQQIFQPPLASPQGVMQSAGKDQTLPIVSIISGALSIVLSFCCYLGLFIGPVALITGFMGMNNANKNPELYDGKTIAMIGMVAGGLGIVISLIMVILAILLQL